MRYRRIIPASFLSLPLVVAGATAAYATDHAEHLHELAQAEAAGIPQLDPTYYPSQIFWLAILFILMYALMSRVALPLVMRVVEGRDEQVRRDLETAHRLRAETEDMTVLYNSTLRDASEEGVARINRLLAETREKYQTAHAETQARLEQKISDTEQFLASEQEALVRAIPEIATKAGDAILARLKKI